MIIHILNQNLMVVKIFSPPFFVSKASSTLPQCIALVDTQICSILYSITQLCDITVFNQFHLITIADSINGTRPQP